MLLRGKLVMAPGENRTSVVWVVADLFVVSYVAATMDSCHRVTGAAGGASSCCTRGHRRTE